MARKPGPGRPNERGGQMVYATAGGPRHRHKPHDRQSQHNAIAGEIVDWIDELASAILRGGRDLVDGKLPIWILAGIFAPLAALSFLGGAALSVLWLPEGFDYGSCVISRLCSSHYNPDGYRYLSTGMIGMAAFTLPVRGWFARCYTGCPVLCAWARKTMGVGLAATALVGIERAWFPTHWTRYEVLHLTFAAVAFLCLWLGLAMFAGACPSPDGQPRVRWRWLFRPPWYLAACVLPIGVVFAMYLPLNVVPASRSALFEAWPKPLVFLRTPTFWQWYLSVGLVVSFVMLTRQARCRQAQPAGRTATWRLDASPAAAAAPHRLVLAGRDRGRPPLRHTSTAGRSRRSTARRG